ncbi:MAG: hypothetical protein RLZZ458_1995 [Planctomycetota bacterium]
MGVGLAVAERAELFEEAWDGFVGRLGFFVFQSNKAAVAGIAKDVDDAGQVSRLFFSADCDRGLDLGIYGPGGNHLEVAIGVVGLEVSAVEVDAEPVGRFDTFDDFEHLGRGGGDAAVIFECEEDAFCGGVFE